MSTSSTPPPSVPPAPLTPPVGIPDAAITIDDATGAGVITGTRHFPGGAQAAMPATRMTATQLAEALRELPVAAEILARKLQAQGGAAQADDVAGIVALVLFWFAIPDGATPPRVWQAPSLLF